MKYYKIEFIAATLIYVMFVKAAIDTLHSLLMVTVIYSSFLALNYYIVPKYWFKKKYFEAVGLTVSVLFIAGLACMAFFSYERDWEYAYNHNLSRANLDFFSRGIIMASVFLLIYGLYVVVRELIIYQYKLSRVVQSRSSRITREIILTFSAWLAVLLPCLLLGSGYLLRAFGAFYFFVLPYSFIVYFLNLYWLIPNYQSEDEPRGLKYFFTLLATSIIVGTIEMAFLLQVHQFSFLGDLVLYWLIPTAAVIALSWFVYRTHEAIYRQLNTLKTALGTSNAGLQYLRAQINPHFLFNALNTLYGAALLEKAENTGAGIQKLGDMMRFMLHENNLDKIALSREIDYLHNYIDLQNMRLALSPNLVIDIQIEDITGYYEIAPMLLIPFIENAYKHGISLQERSWINVNLNEHNGKLHLDVHNSVHPVNMNDPEQHQSGTGLENVKQRLQLLYPENNELVIRKNAKEFFVHLSINLNH